MNSEPLRGPGPLTGPQIQFALLVPALVVLVIAFTVTPITCGPRRMPLPQVSTGQLNQDRAGDLWVTVHGDGAIFIDTKWFKSEAEFSSKLAEIASRRRDLRVVLRLERTLPFSSVRRLLRSVQNAGMTRVFMVGWEGYPYQLMWPPKSAA